MTESDGMTSLTYNVTVTAIAENHSNHKLVSDQIAFLFQIIFTVVLCAILSLLGMVTNVINIVVFIKQGAYKECGIVNLLGLAISDLLCVATMFYNSFCHAILFINPPNIPWDPFDMVYMGGGWPHLMCAQITRAVTAFVAFERCICVVYPFKVKSMFAPKRCQIIIACIFLTFFISYSPIFAKQQLKLRPDPATNVTKLVLVSAPDWKYVMDIMWYINSIVFNQGSVAVVLVCTLITVSRVRLSKTWRQSMTSAAAGNTSSSSTTTNTSSSSASQLSSTLSSSASSSSSTKLVVIPPSSNGKDNNQTRLSKSTSPTMSSSKMQKEKRLITMIASISVIFLACYVPDLTFLFMYTIQPDIRMLGKFQNLALVMYSLTFLMETFNSTINCLVYYRMSTRYREIFRRIMRLDNTAKS